MVLPTHTISPLKKLEGSNADKAPRPSAANFSSNVCLGGHMFNRWLDESANDAQWTTFGIRKASRSKYLHSKATIDGIVACSEIGLAPSRSGSQWDKPSQLLYQIPSAGIPLSLSDGSSRNEEYQSAAAVLDVLSSRVAKILRIDEHTDGQAPGPAGKPQDSVTAGGTEYTEKAKGKRSNLKGRESFDGQDDPHKQMSAPKRLKVAAPPTKTGGRSFACFYFKWNPNYCRDTNCSGRSTQNVKTVIRVSFPQSQDSHTCLRCLSNSIGSRNIWIEDIWIRKHIKGFETRIGTIICRFLGKTSSCGLRYI